MATLLALRQALARALDDLTVVGVSSGAASSVTSQPLINATGSASNTRYGGASIYINAGAAIGQQRRVRPSGYAPSTGTLTVDPPWATVPSSDATLELTMLFPSVAETINDGEPSYRDLIRRALRCLVVPDRLNVTTVANAQSYSLTLYADWLDRPERILAVYDPPRATGFPRPESRMRWLLEFDNGTPTLVTYDRGYPTAGFIFQIEVLRPAYSQVNGAESTTGPTADTDTVLASVHDTTTVALAFAYEALANRAPGRPSGDWSARADAQWKAARALRYFDTAGEQAVRTAAPAAGEAA